MPHPTHRSARRTAKLAITACAAVIALVGCSHQAPPQVAAAPPSHPATDPRHSTAWQDSVVLARMAADRRAADAERAAAESASVHRLVYFSFDQAILTDADRKVLDEKLAWLQHHPNLHLRVAGNCDERGSDEYNLALGQRRAEAAKRYLVNYGVDASRIAIISYGRERPIATGDNPAAWALNRNDQFIVIGGSAQSGG